MNPTEHPQIHDPASAPAVRRLDCNGYNACLTVAVRNDWPGFSCNSCAAYERITLDRARQDMRGMAAMWDQARDRKAVA